jgi:hypothetical protein
MYLKKNILLTFLLTFSASIHNKTTEKKPPIAPILECNQDLLISYGLDGNRYPVKADLDMCPTVEKSCCTMADQLTIYSNWAHGKEEENLHKRFKYHYNVYAHLMNSLIKVFPVAQMIQKKLETKKVSNCKVLARKILHFQIKDIAPKLKEAVRTMHEFFFDSYKGMYCMLCDGATHQYFNLKRKRIIFSERFCRDITANSLHVMLYFHIHFTKFLNLVGTFLSTCDNRGRFNDKAALSPVYIFHTSAKAREEIEQCKTFRNDPNWFTMCKGLCQNFNLTKYSTFFQPHLKKYRMYAEFLAARVRHIKVMEANDPLNQPPPPIGRLLQNNNKLNKDGRLLTAKPAAKPDAKATKKPKKKKKASLVERLKLEEKKWKRLGIFRSALNAIIPIDLFKARFEDPGIELYEFGRASLIDDARYKIVKAALMKKAGKKIATRSSGVFGKNVSVYLAQIVSVIGILFVGLKFD